MDKATGGSPSRHGGEQRHAGGSHHVGRPPLPVDWKRGGNLKPVPFDDRVRSGEFSPATRGDAARKVKLDEQLRLMGQGDVARRMNLYGHHAGDHNDRDRHDADRKAHADDSRHRDGYHQIGPHHPYVGLYHGKVGRHYTEHSFHHHYYGHRHFPKVCYYPRWDRWVDWSWQYRPHVYYDPRPLWCRPVEYDPCPRWVWWDVPLWRPLPVVASGTWVDVPPTTAPAERFDLQLLAVRFVDPGHPEEKLGPRYRVWVRNNSSSPLTQSFNVVLLASADGRWRDDLPQAGVRVGAIGAGDVQSVDVRLPMEVAVVGRDEAGQPAPFATLHVVVDAHREVSETQVDNNGATLARDEILSVDPAAFEVQPSRAVGGGELIVAGEGFGPGPGQVLVALGGQEFEAEILGWYDLGVRVTLPLMPAGTGQVTVVRGDGAAANPVAVTIAGAVQ